MSIEWLFGVINVNKNINGTYKKIHIGEAYNYEDVQIMFEKFELLTYSELVERYEACKDCRAISDVYILAHFSYTNIGDKSLLTKEMLRQTGYGFESKTWYSSNDPFLAQYINVYSKNNYEPGETLKFVSVVGVNSVAFSDRTWKHINSIKFEYTWSLYPNSVKFQLN